MEEIYVNNNIVFDNCYATEESYHNHTDAVVNISEKIKNCINSSNTNFCEMCYLLSSLQNSFKWTLLKVNGNYINFYQYVEKAFGLAKSTANKYINVYNKFCCLAGETVKLTSAYEGFTISKLSELLKVSDKQLLEDLKSNKLVYTMTKKDIREYVKSLKGKDNANKVLEENTAIDVSFNKKIHYTADFFKDFSKQNLIDFILEMQKAYENVKSKEK